MPLINTSVPNLAQGVSQQPDNLRFPGQCDEQINAWSTVVEGLVKRPNSRFLYDTDLGANIGANLFTHFVDRDDENQYLITYDSTNGLKAFDLTVSIYGTGEISIYVPSIAATNYLSCANPLKNLRALTIADSTFLVNTTTTVGTLLDLIPQPLEKEALIFVKLGDYEKSYSIYIDDIQVPVDVALANHHEYANTLHAPSTYISGPSGTGTSPGKHADTELIAKDLTQCLNTRFPAGGSGVLNTVTVTAGNGGLGYTIPPRYEQNPNYTDYKVVVTINQINGAGGVPANTAKGEAVIDVNGTITGINITHPGSNFTAFTGLNPISFTLEEYIYNEFRTRWFLISAADSEVTIAAQLFSANAVPATAVPFSFERQGSVIKITHDLDLDFRVRVSDGLADQGLGVIYKEVDSITDLPKECFNNFRVKIIGDSELSQDDYYVRFKTKDNEDFGEGSWVEVEGWFQDGSSTGLISAIRAQLSPSTMPIRLIPNQGVGKITGFTLRVVGWDARKAGDDNSNPFPTFTDKRINDLFFFKNRLGFLTDDSIIFSEADEYYNFFRTTTQSLLDSAPIDVGISHTKISILKYAQAFQEKLMLFSAKTQFVLRGGDLLTPKTVTISPVTEYDASDSIRPLALSSHIYFNFKRNSYEGLLEYSVDNNTETYNANEITQQVNKYIPSNIVRMEGSASENIIVIQSNSDYKKLFIYKYFWQGNEKVQSAWMSFAFPRDVRSFYFVESTLYIITTDSSGTYLEKIPMENNLVEVDRDYALLLDSRILSGNANYVSGKAYTKLGSTVPRVFDGQNYTDVTFISFSNNFLFQDGMAVYSKNGNKRSVIQHTGNKINILVKGRMADYVSYLGTFYKCVKGHTSSASILPTDINYWQVSTEVDTAAAWSDKSFEYLSVDDYFIGFEYDMLYRFSKQNLKQPTERGGRSASDYTYQSIRNGSLEFSETGHFNVEVTPKFRDTATYTYNPALLASVSTLNKFTPDSGFFKFAVQAQPNEATIEVKSSSALPVKLLSAEFESTIISRSRRYGG